MKSFIAVLAVLALLVPIEATAGDVTVGALKISAPWTRVAPDASKVAAGFMTISNAGAEPETLLSGTVEIAEQVELHDMAIVGGMMRMRELKPGLIIKPGETVVLKPGSIHVMFMGLKAPLKQGAPVKGTLVFEKAGRIEISYGVEPFGTRVPGDGGQPAKAGAGSGSGSGSGSGAMKH